MTTQTQQTQTEKQEHLGWTAVQWAAGQQAENAGCDRCGTNDREQDSNLCVECAEALAALERENIRRDGYFPIAAIPPTNPTIADTRKGADLIKRLKPFA